jgi:hypothetical protein
LLLPFHEKVKRGIVGQPRKVDVKLGIHRQLVETILKLWQAEESSSTNELKCDASIGMCLEDVELADLPGPCLNGLKMNQFEDWMPSRLSIERWWTLAEGSASAARSC